MINIRHCEMSLGSVMCSYSHRQRKPATNTTHIYTVLCSREKGGFTGYFCVIDASPGRLHLMLTDHLSHVILRSGECHMPRPGHWHIYSLVKMAESCIIKYIKSLGWDGSSVMVACRLRSPAPPHVSLQTTLSLCCFCHPGFV